MRRRLYRCIIRGLLIYEETEMLLNIKSHILCNGTLRFLKVMV